MTKVKQKNPVTVSDYQDDSETQKRIDELLAENRTPSDQQGGNILVTDGEDRRAAQLREAEELKAQLDTLAEQLATEGEQIAAAAQKSHDVWGPWAEAYAARLFPILNDSIVIQMNWSTPSLQKRGS